MTLATGRMENGSERGKSNPSSVAFLYNFIYRIPSCHLNSLKILFPSFPSIFHMTGLHDFSDPVVAEEFGNRQIQITMGLSSEPFRSKT